MAASYAVAPQYTIGGDTRPARRRARAAWCAGLAALLIGCGGGGGDGADTASPAVFGADGPTESVTVAKPSSRAEAMRFLTQATFGPTEEDIARVTAIGYAAWIDEQVQRTPTGHRAYWDQRNAALLRSGKSAGGREVLDSFYRQAITGRDQLRGRVAYALSQIFVVSMQAGGVGDNARGAAGWYDLLNAHAFGSYRTLLEGVARHPMMGVYLSHLKNQKEDPATGRVPDENFAREVMQLFSIGLHELNADGTPRLDGNGQPVATYTHDDIAGLAKVFTGFSWAGPTTADGRFWGWCPNHCDADRMWKPMQGYPQFHSTSEKRFLGAVVPAQATPDPDASLAVALDALAAHPNVGPFIGRQLIQRLVTSNPSPAYVARVAAAFADNGQGVRGDLGAVVKAVLLDDEARGAAPLADPTYGKLREPVLRLTAALRALGATSDSGQWLIAATDDPAQQLAQSPLRAPSVFNFYRPGWVAPGTEMATAGRVAPELQITHETTVAGYANYMRYGVQFGFGQHGPDWTADRPDVQLNLAALAAVADQPATLVERVAERLLGGSANDTLKQLMVQAVEGVALRPDRDTPQQVADARRNRARLAVWLALIAPEYQVQK